METRVPKSGKKLKIELAKSDGTTKTLSISEPSDSVELSDVQTFVQELISTNFFTISGVTVTGLNVAYIEQTIYTEIA